MLSNQYYPQPISNGQQMMPMNYAQPQSFAPVPVRPTMYQSYGAPPMNRSYSGLNWVQGEAGAKAFPLGPSEQALLLDSESQVFYIKVTDASGMPQPLRIFDYSERAMTTSASSSGEENYVTRNELDDIRNDMSSLKRMVEDLTAPSVSVAN